MKHLLFALLFSLIGISIVHAQSDCNCAENFKWVKETFEKNDAGFQYIIDQKGLPAYKNFTDSILIKISKASTKQQCVELIHDWLLFFRKDHFSISALYNGQGDNTAQKRWPQIRLQEDQLKKLATRTPPSFTGIWETAGAIIGIIQKGNQYEGAILSSEDSSWKKSELKLHINQDSSAIFYRGNHIAEKITKARMIGKNTLKLDYIYLTRIYPGFKEDDTIKLYNQEMCASVPFIKKLSEKMVLFRVPTFNSRAKKNIDSLITANAPLLKSAENLIIDIRNNGGGSDATYDNILPFLYTNPIRTQRVLMYSTKLNNRRMLDFYNHWEQYGLTKEFSLWAKKQYPILQRHLGEFVNLEPGQTVSIYKQDSIFKNPQHVAIITNEYNGSSAEQFLLEARQSLKVKLFGNTTAGVLDMSNMYFVISPDKQFRFGYSLSKSLRIPDMAIDGKGIMPDFYIDKTIPETHWLNFVQQTLEQ